MPLDELPLSKHIALYNNCAVAVPHELLSTWVGDAARIEARIAELERERNEALEDARAARRERDEAIRTREEQDTEAQRRAVQYCREKREAERERDAALAEATKLLAQRDALVIALRRLVKKVRGVNVYGTCASDEDDDRRAAHELNVAREMADEVLAEIEAPQ